MNNNIVKTKIAELQKENRWQDIIDYLKPIVDFGDRRIEHLRALGFAYSQLDRYDEARYCYKEWLEADSKSAQPYYSIGYTYYDAGKWTEAIEWFDRALEIYPGYIACLYRKGVAQINMLKSKKAKESFTLAIKAYQQIKDEQRIKMQAKFFIKSVFYLGKAYYDLRQFNNALACFKKVNDEDKRNYLAPHIKRYNLAKGFYGIKRYNDAEKILKKMAGHPRAKNYIFSLLGKVLAAKDETEKAFAAFETALKKQPASYIYVYRAEMYEKLGDDYKAEQDYEQALRRDKVGKHKILLALGYIYMKRNKLNEAKNYFHRALEFKKKLYSAEYYDAHVALADCYRYMGEESRAKEEFMIAASLAEEYV